MLLETGELKMERRKVQISEEVVRPLEELVKNYPIPSVKIFIEENGVPNKPSMEFTNRMHNDLRVFESNQAILNRVITERNKFYSTDDLDIDIDNVLAMPITILEVECDARIEYLIECALKLQHKFLDEVLNAGRLD